MTAQPRTCSPMRNRVTPLGDIVAVEQRGAWLGNRGILHEGTEVVRYHRSELWITCRLQYRDWTLKQWQPGHFTVLYFHDEAVAMAAGHRPCALCRREDYNRFRRAWATGAGEASVLSAKQLDHQLHSERIVRGSHRRRLHPMRWSELPDGTFVLAGGRPALVLADRLVPWSTEGYLAAAQRPTSGTVEVITPPSSVGALRAGFRPQLDPTAQSPHETLEAAC